MRRLMLLRHAKSARPGGVSDLDRPLAPRGRAAAPRIGAYMAEERLHPDLALVSPARRTRETWDLVGRKLADVEVRFEPQLYAASPQRLLAVAKETEPGIGTLLMVGHNPGLEELAQLLIGQGDRRAVARLSEKFPTSGLAVIDFPGEDWQEIGPKAGRLDRFVTPKSLGAGEDD